MKHLASLPFALMAAPALAHDGPHLHPHDSGLWLVLVLLLAIGGASLIGADLLALRLVAEDGFALRRGLIPILTRLTGSDLPKPWMI